jgi:hypothetical protein
VLIGICSHKKWKGEKNYQSDGLKWFPEQSLERQRYLIGPSRSSEWLPNKINLVSIGNGGACILFRQINKFVAVDQTASHLSSPPGEVKDRQEGFGTSHNYSIPSCKRPNGANMKRKDLRGLKTFARGLGGPMMEEYLVGR